MVKVSSTVFLWTLHVSSYIRALIWIWVSPLLQPGPWEAGSQEGGCEVLSEHLLSQLEDPQGWEQTSFQGRSIAFACMPHWTTHELLFEHRPHHAAGVCLYIQGSENGPIWVSVLGPSQCASQRTVVFKKEKHLYVAHIYHGILLSHKKEMKLSYL